jgi:hypothetical protein
LSALKTSMASTVKQMDTYYGVGIDHANGFKCTAEDGHYSKFNADVMGFFDALGNQVGGMAYIEGILASISQMITDDATDPAFWVRIGEVTIDSQAYKGLFCYLRAYSATVPALKIVARDNGSVWFQTGIGHGFSILKSSLMNGFRIQSVNPSGSGGVTTMDIAEYGMVVYNSQNHNGFGSDSGGFFKTINDVKTYL